MEICTFWLGSSLRFVDRVCLASMVATGAKVALYCYEQVDNVPPGVELREAEDVLPLALMRRVNPHHPQITNHIARLQFSDLFRIALMRAGKGFWLDTDVYLLQPFLPDPSRFYLAHEGGARLGVSALYFPQDHPLVDEFFAWVDGDAVLPPWLGLRRGVLRPLLYRVIGRKVTTIDAGITIFGNDGISRLAVKHGIFDQASPKNDFYYWTAAATEKVFEPGSANEILSRSDIKGFHIHRKAKADLPPVAGSFFEWAVHRVESRL